MLQLFAAYEMDVFLHKININDHLVSHNQNSIEGNTKYIYIYIYFQQCYIIIYIHMFTLSKIKTSSYFVIADFKDTMLL